MFLFFFIILYLFSSFLKVKHKSIISSLSFKFSLSSFFDFNLLDNNKYCKFSREWLFVFLNKVNNLSSSIFKSLNLLEILFIFLKLKNIVSLDLGIILFFNIILFIFSNSKFLITYVIGKVEAKWRTFNA